MKITIDTKAKTIKIEEENVLLKDLFSFLKEMDIDLKEYSLVPVDRKIEYVYYHYPIYNDPWKPTPWWWHPSGRRHFLRVFVFPTSLAKQDLKQ